jgi:formylglycine-generating enzyme required for sulfatase activity
MTVVSALDTTRVGKYSPFGDSPYGVADMSGSVWEWTSSLWKSYPYRADDGREDSASRNGRVVRGGWSCREITNVRVFTRNVNDPASRSANRGFRVAASPN